MACGRSQVGLLRSSNEEQGGAATGGATATGGVSGAGLGGSGALGGGNPATGGTVAGSAPLGGMAGIGTGGEASVRIVLMPESLADGLVGAAYAVTITARGGVSDTYVFELESGALPPGLALNEEGGFSGTPSESGEFSFTIRATDARGNAGRREYALLVRSRRWLTYMLFESSSSSRQRLMLQDYVDPDSEPIVLSEQPIYDAQFSPDGRRFAFTTVSNGSVDRLYLVDVSGEAPGVPLEIPVASELRVFRWAPDGSKLLIIEAVEGSVLELSYVDWSNDVPSKSIPIARGVFSDWVTSSRLTYQDEAGRFTVVDWENGKLRAPRASNVEGRGMRWLPSLALVETSSSAKWFVDLDTLAAGELTVPGRWYRHPGQPLLAELMLEDNLVRFRRVSGTTLEEPLFSVTGANEWVRWAHEVPWFAKLDGDRVSLVGLEGEPRETPLPGVFSPSDEHGFSPDDRWYAALHQRSFGLFRLTEFGPREASGPVGFPVDQFRFGPGGRAILLLSVSAAGNVVIDAFDLRGESAVPLRTIELDSTWVEAHLSSDGGHAAYVYGSASVGRALSVADLSDPAAAPRLIASCRSAGGAVACPNTVTFQP